MAIFLACPGAGTTQVGPRPCPCAGEIGMRQRLALVALREEQCPRLRPAVCAIAGAGRSVRPRRRSGVPSACAAVAANGTFSSQRLAQLRTADANSLARFDLGAQA